MKVVCGMYTLGQKSLGVQERSDKDLPWAGPVGRNWGPGQRVIIEAQRWAISDRRESESEGGREGSGI